jgi:hypothetical protein
MHENRGIGQLCARLPFSTSTPADRIPRYRTWTAGMQNETRVSTSAPGLSSRIRRVDHGGDCDTSTADPSTTVLRSQSGRCARTAGYSSTLHTLGFGWHAACLCQVLLLTATAGAPTRSANATGATSPASGPGCMSCGASGLTCYRHPVSRRTGSVGDPNQVSKFAPPSNAAGPRRSSRAG